MSTATGSGAETIDETNSEFHLLLDCLDEGAFFRLDGAGRISSWNASVQRLLGYEAADFLGADVAILFAPAERASRKSVDELAEVRAKGRLTIECQQMRKDGSTFTAKVTTVRATATPDDPPSFARLIQDIQAIRTAELIHVETERHFRAIFDQAVEGVALLAPDGTVIDINQQALAFGGLSHAQVIGQPLWNLAWLTPPASTRVRLRAAVTEAATGKLVREELEVRGPSGALRTFDFSLKPVTETGALPELLIAEARDITMWRQLEEQLHHAQKMEAIGLLAAGVAHDFNNVLTVVSGYSQLVLRQLAADDSSRELLGEIVRTAERAATLTRQLLAFGSRQTHAPTVLDVNVLVVALEKMLSRLLGEDVDVVTHLSPHAGCVQGDRSQFERIVLNLALNARDAMPRGGRLTIRTSAVEVDQRVARPEGLALGAYVLLEVSDTGHGMTPAICEQIFEPYFTTKSPGKGTGLGLANVRRMIQARGGSIRVESVPGAGSTFQIFWPRVAETEAASPPRRDLLATPRGSETVLLVEDEASVRMLSRLLLQESGYHVLEARNGEHALRVAKDYREPIHLLVTDVVMPALGGQELAERLRIMYPKLRVLYLSGYADEAIERHGIIHGRHHLLPKPFTVPMMAWKVREVLDGKW